MCILLFDGFKHLLLRKTDILKICRKSKFFRKKIWRNALLLKNINLEGILGKTFILALLSSAVYHIHDCVSDFFEIILFSIKKGFLGNEVNFRDIMNVSPNILAKN